MQRYVPDLYVETKLRSNVCHYSFEKKSGWSLLGLRRRVPAGAGCWQITGAWSLRLMRGCLTWLAVVQYLIPAPSRTGVVAIQSW